MQENLEGSKKVLPEGPAFKYPQNNVAGDSPEQHIILICVHMDVVPYLGNEAHRGVHGGYSPCNLVIVAERVGHPCSKIFELPEKGDEAV